MRGLQKGSSQRWPSADGSTSFSQDHSITSLPHHRGGLCWPFLPQVGKGQKASDCEGLLAIFVCFSTKAVHMEVVSDLSTEAFLATLKRFVSRRGLPGTIHSDNGTNFVGARNDLDELYKFLASTDTQTAIHSFLLSHKVTWQHIPERAPHFGGLWEAAVKSAKHHLKRVIGQQRLTYEEFSTITAQVEACLNSRPLGTLTSHSPDGMTPLTPGHFLVGRPLQAYPETTIPGDPSHHRRWVLCQALTQHFWSRWSGEYLQQLQKFNKWNQTTTNFKIGDLVLVTDGSIFATHWVTGKIVAIYPGRDNLVRAVDVQVPTVCKPLPSTSNTTSFSRQVKVKTSTFRRPITKLSLLLPAEPEPPPDEDQPTS